MSNIGEEVACNCNWWDNGWIYLIEVIRFLASNIFVFNLSRIFSSKNKKLCHLSITSTC